MNIYVNTDTGEKISDLDLMKIFYKDFTDDDREKYKYDIIKYRGSWRRSNQQRYERKYEFISTSELLAPFKGLYDVKVGSFVKVIRSVDWSGWMPEMNDCIGKMLEVRVELSLSCDGLTLFYLLDSPNFRGGLCFPVTSLQIQTTETPEISYLEILSQLKT